MENSILAKTEILKKNIIEEGINISLKFIPKEAGDPWKQSSVLLEKLLEARAKKEPFSMVRLGDGEGRILGYPLYYNDKEIINQVLTYQFGKNVVSLLKDKYAEEHIFHGVMNIKYGLIKAVSNSDILGVPSWLHFRVINESNQNAMVAQALCFTETKQVTKNKANIFDHYIFRQFQQDGFFYQLLKELDFLGVVSHTDISPILKEKFNIESVCNYKIPGHQTYMQDIEPQYPNIYKKIIKDLVVPYQGAIFLVAAGYLGKIYCDEIKNKGGMAIDIGAIFDAWTGIGRDNETKNNHLRL
jgi:hypothetical protein